MVALSGVRHPTPCFRNTSAKSSWTVVQLGQGPRTVFAFYVFFISSALGQKQTYAAKRPVRHGSNVDIVPLFDHLVRASDESVGDVDAECLGGLQIDEHLDFSC